MGCRAVVRLFDAYWSFGMVIFKGPLLVRSAVEELDVRVDALNDEGSSSSGDLFLEFEGEVRVVVGALRIAGLVND